MKRPQSISSGVLNTMLQAVGAARDRRDFQQCIDILETACRRDPANWALLLDLGRMYGLRYDYAAAERCFEKSIRVAPDKAKVLAIAGQQCREFGNFVMAERYYREASEQNNATPETITKLAELFELLRRQSDAAEMVDRALRLDGNCAAALLVRARLIRQAGRLEEAENLLRSFLGKPGSQTVRIEGFYELGGILDRQQRYDEAMSAFLEAKALQKPDASRHATTVRVYLSHMEELRTRLSAQMLQRWFNSNASLQPTHRLAFLGGHPRSGTTLLEQVLDSHSDVVSLEETEIFRDDAWSPLRRGFPENASYLSTLESASVSALQRSRANYFRAAELILGKPVEGRLLIDKNPSLTDSIAAFIRIFPETKILVALRDPRDVCLSCFMQYLPMAAASSSYVQLESTVDEYIAMMRMWRTVSPLIANPWLEVRYEDLVERLEPEARKALEFLGLSWDPHVLGFDEHARKKIIRSPTYADVTKPVYKRAVGRWQNYRKYLEPYLGKLDPLLKAFGYE